MNMRIFLFKTKTNLLRRSRSGKQHTSVLLFVGALCGLLLLVYARGGIGAIASAVFRPILSVKARLLESAENVPRYFQTQKALIGEVQSLKNQLQERDADAFVIKQLQTENAELHTVLGFAQDLRINARVLLRPNQIPYDTFLIDRGARDGIVEGATVYIQGNIATGVVARAYSDSALVRLVSSPGARVTAYIVGANIFTEAEGMGGGVLRVSVPQSIPLVVGDMVVLPAVGTGAYGSVVSVERTESNPDQYGYVTSPIPIQTVRFVTVAKTAPPTVSYQTALETVKTTSMTLFNIAIPKETLVGTPPAPP